MKCVVFDFDGVLVDSHDALNAVFIKVINEELDLQVDEKTLSQYPGMRYEHRIEKIAQERGQSIPMERIMHVIDKGAYEYYTNHVSYVKLFDGAEELLNDLKEQGIKIAMGTNGGNDAKRQLKLVGIDHFFDVVVTYDDVAHGKPAPDMFMRAAELLGLDYQDCVVIEDSAQGLQAARHAGMKRIAVSTTEPPQNLTAANKVVGTIKDITVEMLREL